MNKQKTKDAIYFVEDKINQLEDQLNNLNDPIKIELINFELYKFKDILILLNSL